MTGNVQQAVRDRFGGIVLAVTIAAAAVFLSEHYGGPQMLFALLIGMAFNFLSTEPKTAKGIDFAAKPILRLGVALLGVRLSLTDMMAHGWLPLAGIVAFVALTILGGMLISRLAGRSADFGLLTGGAVAICGASAALAISSVLPKSEKLESNTLFTVVAVTTLSTLAMVLYPVLFAALGLDENQTGFLIGATIHDVAQVVGAGYSVSDTAGDMATLTKLQRVALLPVVMFAIVALSRRSGGQAAGLPWFLVGFVVLMALNSLGLVSDAVRAVVSDVSRWLLVTAISALGVKTSLQAMFAVGPRQAAIVVGETLLLLLMATGYVLSLM
ncbi:MAG: putative sulfate exporter family transporter [Rhodobiaceae bacterium]|nr:putative sulfate exporter family transporter [Rhodobiaceae bacterium]MCC0015803.1 putative sulfate exporter family transporter [Rhodobiaceae bacterium]MCC0040588.1 putative sulfate exporter family transporter [Rhodobiaceae bacterium]MCC0054061.1 putative sulfate exporter family transporter [Rhodobiaceae bacterium]